MEWHDVIDAIDDWALKVAAPGYDLRQKVASVPTVGDVGYYWGIDDDRCALFPRSTTAADLCFAKSAAVRAVGADHVRRELLTEKELSSGKWVKVAYSPTVRRAGEYLNFLPGQLPGGLPNAPSPMAAALTTALVGGGLGYGLGYLGEKVLPEGWGKKLKRTGATTGALLGGLSAVPWMAANAYQGKSQFDGGLTQGKPGAEPDIDLDAHALSGAQPLVKNDPNYGIVSELYDRRPKSAEDFVAFEEALAKLPLNPLYTSALNEFTKKAFMTFGGFAAPRQKSPADVNINALGQTLWDTGASPQLAASAMGALYAAQQLPDPNARQGYATGGQLGQLATNAASDYASGLAFGVLANQFIGTPFKSKSYGAANTGLGLLRAAVGSVFG
jgi:hypothetical protein